MRKLLSIFAIGLGICLAPGTHTPQLTTQREQTSLRIFEIPTHLANRWGVQLREELDLAQQLGSLGMQQDNELYRRLRSIIDQPAFVTRDVDRAFDDLLKLTVNLSKLVWITAGDYYNPESKSWSVISDSLHDPRIDQAVTNLARRAARKPGCELSDLQIKGIPPVFWYEYAMAKFEYEQKSCDALPSYDKLSQMSISRLDRLRELIGDENRSSAHTELVFAFESCKTSETSSVEDLLGVCRWRKEPVDLGTRRKAKLQKRDAFPFFPLKHSAFAIVSKASIEGVVLKAATGNKADTVARTILEISDNRKPGITTGYWLSPDRNKLIFRIDIDPPPPSNQPSYLSPLEKWKSYLVLVTDSRYFFIGVPGGFGQYDDGQLFGISDIDHDGNIEVWFSAEWGECDGEDSVAGENCAITHFYRLEQFGSDLAPYVSGLRPK